MVIYSWKIGVRGFSLIKHDLCNRIMNYDAKLTLNIGRFRFRSAVNSSEDIALMFTFIKTML